MFTGGQRRVSGGSTVSCGHAPPLGHAEVLPSAQGGGDDPLGMPQVSFTYTCQKGRVPQTHEKRREVRHGSTGHSSREARGDCLWISHRRRTEK